MQTCSKTARTNAANRDIADGALNLVPFAALVTSATVIWSFDIRSPTSQRAGSACLQTRTPGRTAKLVIADPISEKRKVNTDTRRRR